MAEREESIMANPNISATIKGYFDSRKVRKI